MLHKISSNCFSSDGFLEHIKSPARKRRNCKDINNYVYVKISLSWYKPNVLRCSNGFFGSKDRQLPLIWKKGNEYVLNCAGFWKTLSLISQIIQEHFQDVMFTVWARVQIKNMCALSQWWNEVNIKKKKSLNFDEKWSYWYFTAHKLALLSHSHYWLEETLTLLSLLYRLMVSNNKIRAKINAISTLSNLIADPMPLDCKCWRQLPYCSIQMVELTGENDTKWNEPTSLLFYSNGRTHRWEWYQMERTNFLIVLFKW